MLLKKLTAKNRSLANQIEELRSRERESCSIHQQLDSFFDHAPVELHLKDREGRYLRVNKQFERVFGVKNDDITGKLPASALNPTLAAQTRDHDLAVLTSGKIEIREESAALATDNRIHTLSTIKFPLFDEAAEIRGLGAIVTDITDQKEAEARFLNIVDTIDGVVWEYDLTSSEFIYVSPQVVPLLGFSIEQFKEKDFWVGSIHPDDQTWITNYSQTCIDDGAESFECEYRIIRQDGGTVWVRSLATIVRDNGSPLCLRGLWVDISDSKDTEDTLKTVESRFRTMFMSAPVGMLLMDLKTISILEVNPAYTKIVGRSVEEIIRLGWQNYTHPDDLEENTYNLKLIQKGETKDFKMIKRFIKPDSSVVWVELTVALIDVQDDLDRSQYLAVIEDITERKAFEEKVWQQANFDALTGLPNRIMLQDRLSEAIKRARRDEEEFAVLLIDLDQFKDVNDTLGHDVGDKLLVEASNRITSCVRESDTVARLGGDEFVIILTRLSFLAGIGSIAQKIIEKLAKPFEMGGNTAYISASIGVTLYPKDGLETVTLMKNADQAMYEAKDQGRNCFHFFTPLMQEAAQQRMLLIQSMREAIQNEEFKLYYQPIIDLRNNQIFKAEALIRWQHPDRGLISPDEFIQVAEETLLINDIGNWVFVEAAKQSEYWQKKFSIDFQISVNASPIQFKSRSAFSLEKFVNTLEINNSPICIEITENLLMSSDKSVLNTLLEFRDAGIQVSLDDFGTGYSSLSYLRKFDIDYLKIDQSFVQNLDYDSDDLALCAAIIVMAHKLDIKVIAEGIETQLQKDLLVSIDCDFGQGYLFSRPVPADEFELLIS